MSQLTFPIFHEKNLTMGIDATAKSSPVYEASYIFHTAMLIKKEKVPRSSLAT